MAASLNADVIKKKTRYVFDNHFYYVIDVIEAVVKHLPGLFLYDMSVEAGGHLECCSRSLTDPTTPILLILQFL
jgi:hypothetical protein